MRIVLFTETFLPKVDGIVTTVCQTVKQLNALGHEVLIFTAEGGPDEFDGSRVVGMKSYAFALYPELRLAPPRASMRKIIQDFKPDLLHVVEPALLGTAGLYYGGGKNGGALHLPLAISYHTDLPKYLHYYHLSFMEELAWPIIRFRHNRASVNLATSATMVRQLTEHGVLRVALWPGGVDADLFHPSRRSAEMRVRLTQDHPGSPLLLYAGRLSAEKSLETLRPMLEALPGARLALVGDGPHRKALEEHFAGLPVFMPGFLRGEELAAAFASADIFVMPSRTETLGLVVLEAMSSGLPVVAARAGGIPEMIEDRVSGYLFDQDSEALATIKALIQSPAKRQAMGQAAREHASLFSWRAATIQLVELYRKACETQHICANPAPPPHPGLAYRARKLRNRAILAILRKLFP
jgi:glycosyltransferase involved in cell wall biosynthesis